jgi:hypothetical protein
MDPLQKPYLRILGLASKKVLNQLLPDDISEQKNTLWFFMDFASSTYKLGTIFDILIDSKTSDWDPDYKMELTGVTDQLGGALKQIEKGYKTISSFKFSPKVPQQIKLLPRLSDWDVKEHTLLVGRHQDIEILGSVQNFETTVSNYEELIFEKMKNSHKQSFTISQIAHMIPRTQTNLHWQYVQYRKHIEWLAYRLVIQGRLRQEGKQRLVLVEK